MGDRPSPASVIKPRERLIKRIEQQGFDQVMEHVAYSWFTDVPGFRTQAENTVTSSLLSNRLK
jgi:hypothetical protein